MYVCMYIYIYMYRALFEHHLDGPNGKDIAPNPQRPPSKKRRRTARTSSRSSRRLPLNETSWGSSWSDAMRPGPVAAVGLLCFQMGWDSLKMGRGTKHTFLRFLLVILEASQCLQFLPELPDPGASGAFIDLWEDQDPGAMREPTAQGCHTDQIPRWFCSGKHLVKGGGRTWDVGTILDFQNGLWRTLCSSWDSWEKTFNLLDQRKETWDFHGFSSGLNHLISGQWSGYHCDRLMKLAELWTAWTSHGYVMTMSWLCHDYVMTMSWSSAKFHGLQPLFGLEVGRRPWG